MSHRHLHLVTFLLVLASWLQLSNAHAWVESSIRSHVAVVDISRDGKALVSHQLVVKVRGGPLKTFRIDGVDDDAELNPDAKVTRVSAGQQSNWPLLLHKSDDGALTLELDDKRGLSSGVYEFRFSYHSDFVGRDLLQQRGASVFVSWVGPRLADGIDSAKAIFKVPKGDTAPRLPRVAKEDAFDFELQSDGVLVSQLRRGAHRDELELVRAHVAKGEPAVWRLQTSARSFDAFTPPVVPTAGEPVARAELPLRIRWLVFALILAFVYAGMVGLKWSFSRKAAALKRTQPRALTPLPAGLRAALAGISLATAFLAFVDVAYPTLAGGLLVVSMLLASELPPRLQPSMRGPGTWVRLNDQEAFKTAAPKLPGRCFDSGSLMGFALFIACLACFVGVAIWLFPSSPYHALVAVLGSASLLPIFCTGRANELPPDLVGRPRRFFLSLARQLRQEPGWQVTALARVPNQQAEPDELRLLVEPGQMPQGFLALELGLEYQVGSGAVVDLPCLIVRARDDSPAYCALPRSVVWSRGRTSSERVALLRPKLPTRAMCAELTKEVVSAMRRATTGNRPQRASSITRNISAGKRLETSNGSMATPA